MKRVTIQIRRQFFDRKCIIVYDVGRPEFLIFVRNCRQVSAFRRHYTILPPKSKAVIEIFAGNMYTVFTCIVKELPFRNFCQLVENGGKTMDFIDLLMEEWNKCCGYFSE